MGNEHFSNASTLLVFLRPVCLVQLLVLTLVCVTKNTNSIQNCAACSTIVHVAAGCCRCRKGALCRSQPKLQRKEITHFFGIQHSLSSIRFHGLGGLRAEGKSWVSIFVSLPADNLAVTATSRGKVCTYVWSRSRRSWRCCNNICISIL